MTQNKLHGWLVIDKPAGITSAHVVAKVKRILKPSKIGHAGTLDPFATGILPLALGEATKTAGYGLDKDKSYDFELTFGQSMDTEDLTGKVTGTTMKRPTEADLDEVLPRFRGPIEQMPPAYSALKIDGKRAYDLARAGKEVTLKPRKLMIHALELKGFDGEKARFSVTCSKGTYVRSLARDIAVAVGSLGYVSALRRTKSGPFGLEQAISLENLENSAISAPSLARLLPPEIVLDDILVLSIGESEALKIRQGKPLEIPPGQALAEGTLLQLITQGQLLAVAKVEEGLIRSQRVFNL